MAWIEALSSDEACPPEDTLSTREALSPGETLSPGTTPPPGNALSVAPSVDDAYRQGLVDYIHDGVALVLVLVDGELEEWDFPAHLLPSEARASTVLRLRATEGTYEVVDIDPSVPSVEERLGRGLNRKRPIVFPLPHREHPPEVPVPRIDERVSRMARGLNQR